MTSRGLERTLIRTGGYLRFRGEWVKGENAGSLSGVFIALIVILSPNLLPSPDKCMGLLQYIFEEVVAE